MIFRYVLSAEDINQQRVISKYCGYVPPSIRNHRSWAHKQQAGFTLIYHWTDWFLLLFCNKRIIFRNALCDVCSAVCQTEKVLTRCGVYVIHSVGRYNSPTITTGFEWHLRRQSITSTDWSNSASLQKYWGKLYRIYWEVLKSHHITWSNFHLCCNCSSQQ